MIEEAIEASTSFSSSLDGSREGAAPLLLRPRREPFEHGFLPIPKLIFADGTLTLGPIQQRLLQLPSDRVDAAELSDALQIPVDHAVLVLDTLAAVLPSDPKSAGADVHDLILFLYMQSYKKLVPRAHKDSASVADVWPSTSAFDGYLSALTPLQVEDAVFAFNIFVILLGSKHCWIGLWKELVRINNRRSIPSQADEEAHQLSYLQKHMTNLIALLAESVEGQDDESLDVRVEHCERVATFNTYYPQLEEHLTYAGVDAAITKRDEPVVLGVVDPHDSLSHPAGVSDVQAESAAYLDPEQFTNFWIPNWFGDLSSHVTRYNPFTSPESYVA